MSGGGIKVVAENRQARHNYFVEERLEAGIILTGTEIKSIRAGRVNLRDSYAEITDGEVWAARMHISPYDKGNRFNHNPLRRRKLLLHKAQIRKLSGKVQQQGMTLVPLRLYIARGLAKVEIGLCRGKKTYDKRAAIAGRDAEREIARAFRAAAR
ncbi:MAG: SsrA-binding protein SmpB [Gracilibacteraceae bacterium]|jgi:SsrA-binding protein|nr:SsrA-binding protein SmpB [Gracilibacteraceae bacterium]